MAVSALALVLLATIVGTATALVANRTGPPCQAASFTAAPQSPARVGSIIVFRPAAICADGPAEFSWYVKVPEEPGWALVQTWGTHEFVWNTSGLRPGVANVDMYARPLGKGGTGIDFSQDYRLEP
jgi:hypothetical protein